MERAVAVKKLSKLLGNTFGYRFDPKAPTKAEREAAEKEWDFAVKERNQLLEKKNARFQEILAADAEYQQLKTASKIASERVSQLYSLQRHYKVTVGTSSTMGLFTVKARGDSWEDVIEKLATKQDA